MNKIGNALVAPALIASALFGFLAVTFAAARGLSYLWGNATPGAFLAIWTATTIVGIALVRQIPRLTEG